ncbi:branched-chain amino acid ABC transporter permease [Clostridiales bacterium PH28_bin88]|nr:branched-chain amino acid ABC transporter permease [Clostridiales bacterium PH28_bin88]
MFLQQLINGKVIGCVYALTAMGATLVYGIMRILDISNAGAYAVGAYIGLFAYTYTGNLLLAFLLGMALTSILGFGVQKFLYAPMMDKPPNVALIASIGLFIFLQDFIRLVAGPNIRDFHTRAILPDIHMDNLGLSINGKWLLILLATGLLLGLLWFLLNRTAVGMAWKATAQDLETAKAMGVNVNVVVALNFLLGYGFAAAAGIMVGILYSSISPTMGDIPAYKMLAVIVLGGLGNPVGTVVAALLIGLAETMVGGYIGFFLPRDAIAFVVLIGILMWRPQGLLGRKGA